MITYYELLEDGTIGMSCKNKDIADDLGLTLTTDREIVYGYDGKRYFKGEEPPRPVTYDDYDAVIEAHLKAEQFERGYTTRSPAEYANSTNVRWAQDAADWIAHVTAVMEYGLAVVNAAKAEDPVPTLDEFKAAIPRIEWTYLEV